MLDNRFLLEKMREEIEAEMNDFSIDFVSDYDIENDNYISDLFSEFSDGAISVYCSDQRKYFNDHTEECENALLNFYCGNDIADYIKNNGLDGLIEHAGVCGWYENNYSQLSEDEENIKKLWVLRYLQKEDIFTLSEDEINDLLNEASDYHIQRTGELIDLINNYRQ